MSLALTQIEGKQALEIIPTFVQGQSDVNFLQGAEDVSIGTMTTTIVNGNYNYNVTVINQHGAAFSSDQPTVPAYEILAWLKGPNFLRIYSEALTQRLSRTGVWFLESEEFRQLVEGRDVIVWGTGMPGAGKTLLSSTSMEHLKEIFGGMQDVAIVCAFIRYTEQLSTRDIFAGLLSQLIDEHPCACNHMERVYVQSKKLEFREQDLLKALREVVMLLSKVFILIDGLDEASDTVKNALLHALPSIGANVLITSRPLDLFAHYVPLALRVSIEACTEDIDLFVDDLIEHNARLQAIVRGQPALISKLKARVRESSRGMFLVARLQMEFAMQTARSAKSLMKALEQLPSGVDAMYRNTLERISTQSEDDTSIAHRVFIWLLYSMDHANPHPAILSIEELQHALAISLEDRAHDDGDIIPASMILSMCGGLVTTEEHTHLYHRGVVKEAFTSVRFIHYTAYEYLKTVVFPDQPLPHTFLAVSCVIYLEQYLEMLQADQDTEARQHIYSHPLLPYAITTWGRHARLSQEYGPLHPALCSFISGLAKRDPLQLRRIWSTLGMSQHYISPLHLAVQYDLVEPITWNTLEYVKGPIQWGGLSPLHYAAVFDRPSALGALLDSYGSKIDDPDFEGKTPLMHACKNCHKECIRRLLTHPDIDVDVEDGRGRTAFWHAAANCAVHDGGLTHRTHAHEILSILLSHFPDIDISVCDKAGETALMGACTSGQVRVVEWLLEREGFTGPEYINNVNELGETALHQICQHTKHYDRDSLMHVLTLLRLHGSDPSLRDSWRGWSALHMSVNWKADPLAGDVLEHLLTDWPTVNINQRDNEGRTALILAATECGYARPDMVQKLLCHPGINVNAQAWDGRTALITACLSKPQTSVVRTLLSHPAIDVAILDHQNMSALDWACRCHDGWALSDSRKMETVALLVQHEDCKASTIRRAVIKSVESSRDQKKLGMKNIAVSLISRERCSTTFGAFRWTLNDSDTVVLLAHARRCRCQVITHIILINCALLPTPAVVSKNGSQLCQCDGHRQVYLW